MRAKRKAVTVAKALICALLLFAALFPIYWLVAMGIRPSDEMRGHISIIPASLTLEHFKELFVSGGFDTALINSLQTTIISTVLSRSLACARPISWHAPGSVCASSAR